MSVVIEHIIWVIGGLALLYFGAEWLVNGASEIALKLGISPLIIGLTVVAFGTSAPELLVCLGANADGLPGMALGNIIGSNICNIALVLGLAAMIRPVIIDKQIIKREIPILILATGAFIFFLVGLGKEDGEAAIVQWEGAILFAGILIYVISSFIKAKKDGVSDSEEFSSEDIENAKKSGKGRFIFNIFLIVVGLLALKYGSEKLVFHGQALAIIIGISPAVISLLLIAFGTSLPELATTIVASRKGQGDLVVGNAIGSCIFNLLAVMGITALVKPILNVGICRFDLIVMVSVTLVILPFMCSKMKLCRSEGAIMLLGYFAYCTYTILSQP